VGGWLERMHLRRGDSSHMRACSVARLRIIPSVTANPLERLVVDGASALIKPRESSTARAVGPVGLGAPTAVVSSVVVFQ